MKAVDLAELKGLAARFVRDRTALERAGLDTHLRQDLDISSADLLDLVLEIEEAYGVRIEDREIATIGTLGDALGVLEARLAARA